VDPELALIGADPSESSLTRYHSLVEALDQIQPADPHALMTMMGSHENSPNSVCLHPDEGEGDEASAVVFSMVCDVEAGRMWVSSGNPCVEPYEEIDLSGMSGAA
jgi:hypothetical protein